MSRSTDSVSGQPSTEGDGAFADKILRGLLHRIEVRNANADAYPRPGRCIFRVSHAWTDGTSIRLIYTTPPSNRTWGLARDTRRSLISPSSWNDAEEAALYYYLLDLEEDWPGAESREPGESDDLIWWLGDPPMDLPGRVSDLPDGYQYSSPPVDPTWIDHAPASVGEPRRYADPDGPFPPGVQPSTH